MRQYKSPGLTRKRVSRYLFGSLSFSIAKLSIQGEYGWLVTLRKACDKISNGHTQLMFQELCPGAPSLQNLLPESFVRADHEGSPWSSKVRSLSMRICTVHDGTLEKLGSDWPLPNSWKTPLETGDLGNRFFSSPESPGKVANLDGKCVVSAVEPRTVAMCPWLTPPNSHSRS